LGHPSAPPGRIASAMIPSAASRPAHDGYTLLELITVLTLLGLVTTVLLSAARHQLDRMAVLGAREEVAGLFHRARAEAIARGGARLFLEADPASAVLSAGDEVLARAHLKAEYGVALTLSSSRPEADLSFDALGLGRVASQTLRFARGRAEVRLVVSSLGRVTRP
jgi:prepilin-type N-terminal cleavage/methylation domain-containing protein